MNIRINGNERGVAKMSGDVIGGIIILVASIDLKA